MTLLISGILISGCANREDPTEPDNLEIVGKPWTAVASAARSQNPYAWVGDEHNRLVYVAMVDFRAKGVKSWTREAKCQWLARLVLTEALSSRAPKVVRDVFRGEQLDAAKFERATARLGCKAQDAGGAVSYGTPVIGGPFPHLEDGDTIDYEASPGALYYLNAIDAAVQNSTTPNELNATLSAIQTAADSLWDKENVLSAAAIASSSAFYWQAEFGGTPDQPWASEPETAPGMGMIRIDPTMAHSDVGDFLLADLLGCVGGLIPFRKSIWKSIWNLRKLVNPGVMLAECGIYGGLASVAQWAL